MNEKLSGLHYSHIFGMLRQYKISTGNAPKNCQTTIISEYTE